MDLKALKTEIVKVSRALHSNGWVANHEGNVTVRLDEKTFLATPTAMSKADVLESDLLVIDADGKVIEGVKKIFSEIPIHLCVYRGRPDINAVIHAHPPYATAMSICRVKIDKPLTPEFAVSIGNSVPLIDFAIHTSKALSENIERHLDDSDVLMLANHGALSFGRTLSEALLRMEHLEEQAKLVCLAKTIGRPRAIDESSVRELEAMRTKAGLGKKGRRSDAGSENRPKDGGRGDVDSLIKKVVREELSKNYSGRG